MWADRLGRIPGIRYKRSDRRRTKGMDWNEAQKTAVCHNHGPMLVLAGPGSGKTAVITERTCTLIEEYGVNPNRILVITFTKAAAREMQERFQKRMQGAAGVSFGTFHAVFFKILKYAYNYSASNILRDEERKRYLKEIIEGLSLEIEDMKEFIEGIESEISLVKGERMAIENYYSINCSEEDFQKIYRAYEKRLREANRIDFDDMLLLCYELLTERKDILRFWQEKYEYILIDEFQDINRVQYEIIRMLAKPQNNLFIVGDDDQSIYRFRGARPELMLNFEKDYPQCKRVLLNYNYRSAEPIVEGALRVVENNANRFPKQLKAARGSGEDICIRTFPGSAEQNQQVIEEILNYHSQGIPYQEMAVLFRTNTQPRALLGKLLQYNIPFKMKDTVPNLYDHWISRDIIAYLTLASGVRERALFLSVMNRPKRYLSREAVQEAEVNFDKLKEYYGEQEYRKERIEKLEYDLLMLRSLAPYAAVTYLRRAVGYDSFLSEYAKFRRIKEKDLFDVLDELQESAKQFHTFPEWLNYMDEYREELKQQTEQKQQRGTDAVELITFHGSKGLEYQVAWIVDANEEITPHRKALLLEDMEEERRMFYVAMTRAKDRLHIYSIQERYGKPLECSRFVGELLLSVKELRKGMKIRHSKYGTGRIIEVAGDRLRVRFESSLIPKVLSLDYCQRNHLVTMEEG